MIGWKPDIHVIFGIRRKQISTIRTVEKVGLVFCWWAPFPQLSLPLIPALSCNLFWNLSVTLSSLTGVMPEAPAGSLFWVGFLWPFASLWVWMTLAAEWLVCVSFSKFKHSSRNFIPQGWGAPRELEASFRAPLATNKHSESHCSLVSANSLHGDAWWLELLVLRAEAPNYLVPLLGHECFVLKSGNILRIWWSPWCRWCVSFTANVPWLMSETNKPYHARILWNGRFLHFTILVWIIITYFSSFIYYK